MTQLEKQFEQVIADLDVLSIKGKTKKLVTGVHFDSRRVREGDVFVALPGLEADGHDYIEDAISQGAAAVVVSRPVKTPADVVQVQVENSRKALAKLAANFYGHPSKSFSLVGITGTNGKTTLTYLLEQIFITAGYLPAVIGTVNVRYQGVLEESAHTTPESSDLQAIFYRMSQKEISHVVIEVSSHALDLNRVQESHFKVAVFTNLSRDHLDYHKSLEKYAAAKSLLFSRELVQSQADYKVAVANSDDHRWQDIVGGWNGKLITFGFNPEADVHPLGEPKYDLNGFETRINYPGGQVDLQCHLPGRHNLQNALAAMAAACALGIPAAKAARGVTECKKVPGRLEPVNPQKRPAVFVDYAHSDHALENVLAALRELTPGRLIVVFGCGGDRDRGKRPLMGKAVARGADLAWVTSDNPRTEDPNQIINEILPGLFQENWQEKDAAQMKESMPGNFAVLPDRQEAICQAIFSAKEHDVVLVAGKGHEDYQIVGTTKLAFDDRLVAQEALADCEQVE
jgi:UDP-N-acetylmuramoyl-L-alanyl-D-glutamate--2,6-diaminopimelate ligase